MLSFFIVPLIIKELYPFSAATMFAFSLKELATYDLRDNEGNELDPESFGLAYGPNIFDPPVDTLGRYGHGRRAHESLLKAGKSSTGARPDQVIATVKKHLAAMPHIKYVTVTQTVHGAIDAKSVGTISQSTWKVEKSEQ